MKYVLVDKGDNIIENVELEDKSFLHKNHKSNNQNKFHIKIKVKSEKLKNMSRIESNKFIFKLLDKGSLVII